MKRRRGFALLLALLLLTALCGCGAAMSGGGKDTASSDGYATGYSYTEEMYEPEPESVQLAVAEATAADVVLENGNSSVQQQVPAAVDEEKIIYSCQATIETKAFDECCQAVYDLVERTGGFLERSEISGSSVRSGYFVLRIPREQFQAVTDSLEELGNVPYRAVQAENITAQYQDTESRLSAYQTEQERLMQMLGQAETVEEMLAIESRLSEVRYEIESLTSSLQNWDSKVYYSTVSLSVEEVRDFTEVEEPAYWDSVREGFFRSLEKTGEFLKDLFRFLVQALPGLVLLAVVLTVLILWLRGGRKRRARREQKRLLRQQRKAARRAEQPGPGGGGSGEAG